MGGLLRDSTIGHMGEHIEGLFKKLFEYLLYILSRRAGNFSDLRMYATEFSGSCSSEIIFTLIRLHLQEQSRKGKYILVKLHVERKLKLEMGLT